MRAMILAAGLGTRLRPLTLTTPKPLLPIAGTPLIVWNLLLLRRHGIRDVIINLHHLGDQLEKALGHGEALGMSLTYSYETTLLGTGGGLKQAQWFFRDEPGLVLNGDTLVELDLEALMARHRKEEPIATMVVRDDPHLEQWGRLELDGRQRVVRINGQGGDAQAVYVRMFAGIHVIHPRVLETVPVGIPSSIIEAYVAAIRAGETVLGYSMQGYWSDVGTPERYAETERDAEAGRIMLAART